MKLLVIKKRTLILAAIAVLVAVILILTATFAATTSAFSRSPKKLPIYSVDTESKVVAISFDCAWGVDYTNELLSIMKENDVVSTFFMVEFWAEKYPDYVKRIDEEGHTIGTHSSTHSYMSKLEKSQIIKELTESSKAISDITGKKVELFRPPYGDYDDLLISTAESLGLYTIQWDVDSLDWKDISAGEIENRVLGKVKNGSIVLFHNNGLHTAEAVRSIIPKLKEQGYEFKSIADMILREDFYMDVNGRQISAKKNF